MALYGSDGTAPRHGQEQQRRASARLVRDGLPLGPLHDGPAKLGDVQQVRLRQRAALARASRVGLGLRAHEREQAGQRSDTRRTSVMHAS